MSLLTYNGVTLPYPLTTGFNQEAVYDDAGGLPTDRILTRFDISVQTIVTADYLAILAPDLVGTTQNPADIMQIIRSRLMKQRQTLSFSINGKELMPKKVAGNIGAVDARNGPIPQTCVITELTNSTFLVTYRILAHYWENNTKSVTANGLAVTNAITGPILFNRWTETVEMDNCQMSTRTRDGKFTIRSDNPQGKIADQMREQMAVVGIPNGFLRVSSKYSVSTDGLTLSYTVIDKEAYKMPPKPAFEADGEYTESCNRLGAIRYADLRVRLKGDDSIRNGRDTQGRLIQACFSIIFTKLELQGAGVLNLKKANGVELKDTNSGILENFSLRVWMYENIVECSARVMFKVNKKLIFKSPAPRSLVTATPLSDAASEQAPPPYKSRGTALLLLQAANYYDPSVNMGDKLTRGLAEVNEGEFVLVGNKAQQLPKGKMPGQVGRGGE